MLYGQSSLPLFGFLPSGSWNTGPRSRRRHTRTSKLPLHPLLAPPPGAGRLIQTHHFDSLDQAGSPVKGATLPWRWAGDLLSALGNPSHLAFSFSFLFSLVAETAHHPGDPLSSSVPKHLLLLSHAPSHVGKKSDSRPGNDLFSYDSWCGVG